MLLAVAVGCSGQTAPPEGITLVFPEFELDWPADSSSEAGLVLERGYRDYTPFVQGQVELIFEFWLIEDNGRLPYAQSDDGESGGLRILQGCFQGIPTLAWVSLERPIGLTSFYFEEPTEDDYLSVLAVWAEATTDDDAAATIMDAMTSAVSEVTHQLERDEDCHNSALDRPISDISDLVSGASLDWDAPS